LPPPPAAYQLQVAEPIHVVGQPSPAGGQEPRSWTLQIPRPMAGGEDVTPITSARGQRPGAGISWPCSRRLGEIFCCWSLRDA
jgi:hypothetical protein